MNSYDAIVIGGGLSGLSAAVELSKRGRKILLLEQNQHCGGRTYSFIDKTTGSCVDNGQHLMLGCYNATQSFLKTIGSDNLVYLQPSLKINFLTPFCHKSLVCPELPAPIHLVGGLLSFDLIPLIDRVKMFKFAFKLLNKSKIIEAELDKITVSEWLSKLGQTELSKKYFWDILTIGALNNFPDNVSALMLYRVLRATFFGDRRNSSLLIPCTGLSELFVYPAVCYIEKSGGKVLKGVSVSKFVYKNDKVQFVETTAGKKIKAEVFISAVPWYSYKRIKQNSNLDDGMNSNLSQFVSSPIISIHLWLDSVVTNLDFATLIGTRIQWLFNKNKLLLSNKQTSDKYKQYISLVISGAQKFIGLTNSQLVNIAVEDLKQVLPDTKYAKVVRSIVIKEKRATFLPAPNLENCRPDTKTEFKNLFLAGDWTNTGYPATIEGAIISGIKSATNIN